MHQYNRNKKSNIPTRWFFFNPTINLNHKVFYNLSNKVGVVFFCNEKVKHFYKKIQPFAEWCIKKKIKFLAPHSTYWAYRNSAYGIFVNSNPPNNLNLPDKRIIKNVFMSLSHYNGDETETNFQK